MPLRHIKLRREKTNICGIAEYRENEAGAAVHAFSNSHSWDQVNVARSNHRLVFVGE